ncbi:MAG: sulfotransferase [Xenococcaceae cyanobacterium MO_188.B32]|nr:sulfotransferase [Xenococcaceae cyanobacterium MO_188.B32]
MAHADLLIKFADFLLRIWQYWKIEKIVGSPETLYECLGNCLTSFLNSQGTKSDLVAQKNENYNSDYLLNKSPKRIVTKSPFVKNLSHFFQLFPHSPLLIIVRDGRAVVESSVKTFERTYEQEIRAWANAASTIIQAESEFKKSNRKYLIVRYEEVFSNTEKELENILAFLGLDARQYDFNKALKLPVRGSSELKNKLGKVHWQKVEKSQDFNPLMRYSHWGRGLHERFNWIAGDYLEKLGYTRQTYSDHQFWWSLWNMFLDAKYLGVKGILKRLKHKYFRFFANLK